MSYPKYIDLNIGVSALTHLTIEDALKEIISNAYDEHTISEKKRDIKIYEDSNKNWCIRDYGRGITTSNFKFNKNDEKEDNNDIIGFFGYGLKDAIAIMHTNNIKFKIFTKKYIYTPVLKSRQDFPDEYTIHIEIIKNTIYELKSGTEFVFDNITLNNITNAKEKFIKFLNPKILSEIDGYKIFRLDSFQSIFVNGVEVYKNTGFHFSYDIISSENIRKCFNRDRKQLNLSSLKPYITKVLQSLKIINNNIQEKNENENEKNNDDELFQHIQNILKVNSLEYLQEFNQIDVLRNIITQINSLNKYVFVGTKEKLTKIIKEKIKDNNKEVLILGDGVKSKFRVKFIKDLYFNENFDKDLDVHINTLINYLEPPKIIDIKDYISNIIRPIERLFTIPENLKNNLLNIEVINVDDNIVKNDSDDSDDSDNSDDENDIFEKEGYDFSGDKLKITNKYIDEKNKKDLFVILFRYIVNNVDDNIIKNLSETRRGGWFW